MQLSKEQRVRVDLLGELQRKIAEFRPVQQQADLLTKEVAAWIPKNTAPDEAYVLEGDRYSAQVSPRSNERKVKDFAGIFRAIGKTAFLAAASIPLKVLDVVLTDEQKQKFVTEERTGSRRVVTIARAQEAIASSAEAPRSRSKLRTAA